jgi:transcriptional regulator with XRE-family HTH domain
MNLGKAIKDLRKEQGLSQEQLAKAANITQAALSQIENGKRPGSGTLKKVSKALKVPVSLIYVVGIEKDDVPKEKQVLYDQLFPVIQSLVMKIAVNK